MPPDVWQGVLANVTVPAFRPQATLSGLLPAFAYHLRVIANNSIGVSPPSDVVTATTLEEGRRGGNADSGTASRRLFFSHGSILSGTAAVGFVRQLCRDVLQHARDMNSLQTERFI